MLIFEFIGTIRTMFLTCNKYNQKTEITQISSCVNCEGYNFWVYGIVSGIDCFGKGCQRLTLFLSGCQRLILFLSGCQRLTRN